MRGRILCVLCVVLVAAEGAAAGEVDSPRSISRQEREEAVKKIQDAASANRWAEPWAVWMLRSELRKDREQAVKEIVGKRERLIAQLIELADEPEQVGAGRDANAPEPPWRGAKHLAILLLGELRASEAVPVLIKNLQYRNPRKRFTRYWEVAGVYPAADALSKIGIPAVGPLVEYLKTAEARRGGEWFIPVHVIGKILGPALAAQRIELELEKVDDQQARKSLTAAVQLFERARETMRDSP